jgi:hypothetical protein
MAQDAGIGLAAVRRRIFLDDNDDDIHMDYGMKCERWLGENGGRPIDHLLFYIIFAGHRRGRHQPPHTHTTTPPITELRADHSWIDPFIHRNTIERVWWFPAAARNNQIRTI